MQVFLDRYRASSIEADVGNRDLRGGKRKSSFTCTHDYGAKIAGPNDGDVLMQKSIKKC